MLATASPPDPRVFKSTMSSLQRTGSSDSDSDSDAASFHSAQSDGGGRGWPSQPERAPQHPSGLEDAFANVFTDEIPDSQEPIREMFAPDVKEEPQTWEGMPRENFDASNARQRTTDNQNESHNFDVRDEGSESEDEDVGREMKDQCDEAEIEELLSPAETERLLAESLALKTEGNGLFGTGNFREALDIYSRALELCPKLCKEDRAVLFGNKAACWMKLEEWKEAARDCGKALKENPTYAKALWRRAQANEKLDTSSTLADALEDCKTILSMDPTNRDALRLSRTLPVRISARAEAEKNEAIGKLKQLGNSLLGMVGLSTDNFQMIKDEATGGYSLKFTQGGGAGTAGAGS